jgi:mannose-6-phosphate isomerase-like protein (cupin superfamily)
MQAFKLSDLIAARQHSETAYYEFLRVRDMSTGLYQLAAGSADLQQPHTEDELYYVVQGRAHIRVGDEDAPVASGSLVFVAANVDHRFHTITEDLTVLVFFAPAEYARQDAHV